MTFLSPTAQPSMKGLFSPHNYREKGEGTQGKTKERIQKKQGREAQGKTKAGPTADRLSDTGTSDDLLLRIGRESSGKDESRPTMALSAGHRDSGPIGNGLPYRDACAVIVPTTFRSAGSQWTA